MPTHPSKGLVLAHRAAEELKAGAHPALTPLDIFRTIARCHAVAQDDTGGGSQFPIVPLGISMGIDAKVVRHEVERTKNSVAASLRAELSPGRLFGSGARNREQDYVITFDGTTKRIRR
jgi:hypothetical protein